MCAVADFTLPQVQVAEGYHRTAIEWTDVSANPLRAVTRDGTTGWACVKVSSGCANCYAESVNKRFGTGRPFTAEGMRDVRVVLDEQRIIRMGTAAIRPPYRSPDGRPKCFIGDMTDIFGEWVDDNTLDCLFATFALRPDIDFQILTKRPERMAEYLLSTAPPMVDERSWKKAACMDGERFTRTYRSQLDAIGRWPLLNVWLGTSVEDQRAADERIPHLLRCPAAVRFLSVEPLLGLIEFSDVTGRSDAVAQLGKRSLDGIDWVIVGGESGQKARECNVESIRSVVRQCKVAGVRCFVKQLGSRPMERCVACDGMGVDRADRECRRCDGQELQLMDLADPKGGDPSQWPEDLRVRQWPEVRR